MIVKRVSTAFASHVIPINPVLVICEKTPSADGVWDVKLLTRAHNCGNQDEVERIRLQHPNEEDCVCLNRRRTLGLITLTRCESHSLPGMVYAHS